MNATEGQRTGQNNGLAKAERYYREYGSRALELRGQGKGIMGYLSALGPVEIITAAGLVPLRLRGDVNEPITKADAHMETIVCPFVRNVFDAVLKGKYEYLDGIVIPHLCDSTSRTYDTWAYNAPLPYSFFLNVPHASDGPSLEFFKAVLGTFIKSLERLTGTQHHRRGPRTVREGSQSEQGYDAAALRLETIEPAIDLRRRDDTCAGSRHGHACGRVDPVDRQRHR